MRIIDRVDINYFRSISSLSLTGCRDINIIAGQNDAGKSNILKALNLFFNNSPERDEDFEFLMNLNRAREDEARAAKGRMTIWIKVHFNNFLNWKSLPKKFYVKRSWNRYEDRPADTFPDSLPGTTIGRFLNKLQYHYIPAVRDREIYGDLLADLHDTLVKDESVGLRKSSNAFVDDLDKITDAMSAKILERLKIESRVNIPGDLQDFFRALDFSTKFNKFDVPLPMRGDGIQSRHIPFILDYIANKSSHYHIWGYEEPENSLEMSRAYEMAEDFRDRFSLENQIFVTTHSPSFYDIRGDNSARWLIEGVENGDLIEPRIEPISSSDIPDKSLGLVSVIAPRIRELREEYDALQTSLIEMSDRVVKAECPVVFVEGPTDVAILSHAKNVLGFSTDNYRFESANGATEITAFLKLSTRVKPDARPLCGVYDADATGRVEFEKCKGVHKVDNTEIRVLDRTKRIYAAILSVPPHLGDAVEFFQERRVGIPLAIEFMFDRILLGEAQAEGALELRSRTARLANHELPLEIKIDELEGIPDHLKYLFKEVSKSSKQDFANWIVQKDASAFEPFRGLLEQLALALG